MRKNLLSTEKKTYICSPLSAKTAEGIKANMYYARCKCAEYAAKGYNTIAPHAWLPELLNDREPAEREIALSLNKQLLSLCDTLIVCGTKISGGMKKEIEFAINNRYRILVEPQLEEKFKKSFCEVAYGRT